MFGSGRTVGIIVVIGGGIFACAGSLISIGVGANAAGARGWMTLGLALSLMVALSIMGLGTFFFRHGQKELRELATIQKQKIILTMIKTRGQVKISDVVSELETNTDEVKRLIYDLVGEGLFHGYINWDDAILYSKHTLVLQGATHCPSCGGKQKFAGHGVVQCRHCNAQIFL